MFYIKKYIKCIFEIHFTILQNEQRKIIDFYTDSF